MRTMGSCFLLLLLLVLLVSCGSASADKKAVARTNPDGLQDILDFPNNLRDPLQTKSVNQSNLVILN